MENLVAGAVIIGIVNGIRLMPQTKFVFTSFHAFGLALLLGVVFGFIGYFDLTIESGIITALATSGLYQVAKKVGGN